MFYSGTHGNRGQTRYFLKRELFLSGDETRMKPVENNRFFGPVVLLLQMEKYYVESGDQCVLFNGAVIMKFSFRAEDNISSSTAEQLAVENISVDLTTKFVSAGVIFVPLCSKVISGSPWKFYFPR
jgi:hypothetical protein